MAFESLGEKIQQTMKKLRGRGKLTEQDVDQALREVRLALLEADVNFKVVKDFVARVREEAVGEEVMSSLTPGQQVVKVVHGQLTALMGGQERRLRFSEQPPTVIMMIGLQGSGKTTSSGKLSRFLHASGRHPLLVAADVYRPAAAEQLQQLGKQLDLPVLIPNSGERPDALAIRAVQEARQMGRDTVVIDTAGRLHIDEDLMDELVRIQDQIRVDETLLVLDAMTGQDAVTMAQQFADRVQISGIVLTKMDGDARGGAALSVLEVTGCPVKFVGMGEKLDAFEVFHPDRMASRILGMGDVLTLIEKAEKGVDLEKAKQLEQKLLHDEFTLDDFLEQIEQVKQMGPLDQLMSMIPGMGKHKISADDVDEGEMKKVVAIIQSMTREERAHPDIIKRSRRRRIAQGSGTRVQDVNRLLKQFAATRDMIRQISKGGRGMKRLKNMGLPF